MKALINEFAKMRHLHVWLLALGLAAAIVGIGLYVSVLGPAFDRGSDSAWNTMLGGMWSGIMLASPLLLAVMASRLVDIEHQSQGWLMSATSNLTGGSLCRAKFIALGLVVTAATVGGSLIVLGAGWLVGVTAPVPLGRWLGFTAAVLLVNLVVLAIHVLLSARIENQLVGIGVGLVGTIISLVGSELPAWAAHLTPWGYYALSSAAEHQGDAVVALTPSYLSVASLGAVIALVFITFTGRLDRQEV